MKKLIITAVILFSCLTFKNANAQLSISAGINIGNQPEWGPTGYNNAAYYYIPGIEGYYDINAHQYIYLEGNSWVHRAYLPARYRNYDLYHGYKVVVNDRNPWLRNSYYRGRYYGYRNRRDQAIIRNSRDARYRNHWRGVQLNRRDNRLDNRAQNLRQRDNNLDHRAHNLNQRDNNLDKRAQAQKQRDHQLDERAKRLNEKAKRERQNDHK